VNRARLNAMNAENAQSQHRFQHSPLTPGINGSNPKYQFVPTFSRLDDQQQPPPPPPSQLHTRMDYNVKTSRRISAYPELESVTSVTGPPRGDHRPSSGSKHLSIPPPIKLSQDGSGANEHDRRYAAPLYSPTSDMFNLSLNPTSQPTPQAAYFDSRRNSGSISAPQTPTHQGPYPATLATPPGVKPVSTSSSPYHRRSHSHSYSLPPTPAYSDHSAIDLLATAAEYVQKSEEKRKRRASEQMILPPSTRAELRSVRSKSGSDAWGSVTEDVEEEEKQDEQFKPKSFRPWE
jgi:hypothetical protein